MMTCQQIARIEEEGRWESNSFGSLSFSHERRLAVHSTRCSNTPINSCRGRFSWKRHNSNAGGENILNLILANYLLQLHEFLSRDATFHSYQASRAHPHRLMLPAASTGCSSHPYTAWSAVRHPGEGRQLHLKGWQIIMKRIGGTSGRCNTFAEGRDERFWQC